MYISVQTFIFKFLTFIFITYIYIYLLYIYIFCEYLYFIYLYIVYYRLCMYLFKLLFLNFSKFLLFIWRMRLRLKYSIRKEHETVEAHFRKVSCR